MEPFGLLDFFKPLLAFSQNSPQSSSHNFSQASPQNDDAETHFSAAPCKEPSDSEIFSESPAEVAPSGEQREETQKETAPSNFSRDAFLDFIQAHERRAKRMKR